MKDHFFVASSDNGLYDTRPHEWHLLKPIRPVYRGHFQRIETTHELKATLRAGACSDVGGYPLYFIASDGEALSFEAVRDNLRDVLDSIAHRSNDGWRVVGCDINYEDDDLTCSHTGKRIPSAYGDGDV